ncbi:uncharacterized protein LOC135835663 [Planococcus citri]|uniref:uncharacterized protein LOC135835663 n=1 Tax=Planococcus citri TaxID=170843 RepID=UPI0031FA25B9
MLQSKYYEQLANSILTKAETVRGQFLVLKKELEAANKKNEQLESKLAQTSEERDLLLSTLNKLLSNEESDFTNKITINCDEKLEIRSSGSEVESSIADNDFKYDDDKLTLGRNTHHKQAVDVVEDKIPEVKDERNFPEGPERSHTLLEQALTAEDKIPDVEDQENGINSPECLNTSSDYRPRSPEKLATLEPVSSVPEGQVKIESNDVHDGVDRNVVCTPTKKKKHLNCSKSKKYNETSPKKISKQRTLEKRCLICKNSNNGLDKPYRTTQLLDEHIRKNHPDYSSAYIRCPYVEGKCNRHFLKMETLILHVTFRHQDESSRTPLWRFFPDLKDLWECSVCDKKFSKPHILAKHIRRMHGMAKKVIKCAARGYILRTIRQIMSLENFKKTPKKKSIPASASSRAVEKEPNINQVNDIESISDSDASNDRPKAQTAEINSSLDDGDENSSLNDSTESIHWCSFSDGVAHTCKNYSDFEVKIEARKTRSSSPRLRRSSTRLRDLKTKIGNVKNKKQNQAKSSRKASLDEKNKNGADPNYKDAVFIKAIRNNQRVKLRSASLPYDLRRWVIGNARVD